MFFLSLLFLVSNRSSAIAALPIPSCPFYLSELTRTNSVLTPTTQYLNLTRYMTLEKNIISTGELETISNSPEPLIPTIKVNNNPVTGQVYRAAMENLLSLHRQDLKNHWDEIKAEVKKLLLIVNESSVQRQDAKRETIPVFAPVEIDFIKYESIGEGSVRFTFTMEGGAMMAVLWDGHDTYLFDVEKKNRILLGGKFDIGDHVHHLQLPSGSTLISTYINTGKLNFYELTPQHELKIIKEGVKAVIPLDDIQVEVDLKETHLTISPQGRIAFLEKLTKGGDFPNRNKIFYGYLEVEIETGNQRIIPILNDGILKSTVLQNGHVVSYGINEKEILFVRDLSTDTVINEISVPADFRSEVDHFSVNSFQLGSSESERLFLKNFSLGARNSRPAKLIDVRSGEHFDLARYFGDQNEQKPIIVVKKGKDYQIVYEPDGGVAANTIWVYDQLTKKLNEVPLSTAFTVTRPRIIKLKNGESILFVGSARSTEVAETFFYLILREGIEPWSESVNVKGVKRFVDAYETKDERIEAIFETEKGFKIIQVYGPAT